LGRPEIFLSVCKDLPLHENFNAAYWQKFIHITGQGNRSKRENRRGEMMTKMLCLVGLSGGCEILCHISAQQTPAPAVKTTNRIYSNIIL
jgi:hypothetical protein